MIGIESELFTLIANALRDAYSGIYVTDEYVSQPTRFPTASIVEMDNTVLTSTIDSGSIENFVEVMYQVDVYSNLNKGKKAQAKAIIAAIDDLFQEHGFVRSFLNPIQNMNEPTIYRMTARYRAVVSKDHLVYRR